MRVLDLFCGPGGLSTGFEMAGMKIVAAYDYDKSAVETFSKNHDASAELVDLGSVDMREMPDADIIIGGPPCTQFSSAKSNRTRNILQGLNLVQAFLRCVYYKKPKYWVMENVPTIQKYLPKTIPLRYIGIDEDGDLEIPQKAELIAADYGVPQKRRRYLIGNFPLPDKTHTQPGQLDLLEENTLVNWISLGEALGQLPSPFEGGSKGSVKDPNYDLTLEHAQLTDHFYDSSLTDYDAHSLSKAKLSHPYMGKLAWPDRTDQPARTIVATQLGRETLVLEEKNSRSGYRRATVRECAILQSFPITYQFFGSTYSTKYRLVGDAVPPRMAFAIANQIAINEGGSAKQPIFSRTVSQPANKLGAKLHKKKRKPNFKRQLSMMLPRKEVRGYRAELFSSHFSDELSRVKSHEFFTPVWSCRLVLGEGKGSTKDFSLNNQNIKFLKEKITQYAVSRDYLCEFEEEYLREINKFPKNEKFYFNYVSDNFKGSPLEFAESVEILCENWWPVARFDSIKLDCSELFDHPKARMVKVRVAVGAVLAYLAAQRFNGNCERGR